VPGKRFEIFAEQPAVVIHRKKDLDSSGRPAQRREYAASCHNTATVRSWVTMD